MKKTLALILASTMALSMLASCSSSDSGTGTPDAGSTDTGSTGTGSTDTGSTGGDVAASTGIELQVVTSYGGDDGNKANYVAAYEAFQNATGHEVKDSSATSDETWKAQVTTAFETDTEPHVLFYFTGADADKIIAADKVVPIATIQESYPEYASNMKADMLPTATNGEKYAIPVNGYWEGLYVNKTVLADVGVALPGADYEWNTFLQDCQRIKDAGYTPIAASLHEVPHYWFEFCVLNNGSIANHTEIPAGAEDAVASKWGAGLDDIRVLYQLGYFPSNTLTATDAETVQMMADNEAAFLIDGNWKIGWFEENATNIEDFTVTYVPGKGDRVATEVVGGLSMGYYITEKAWQDEELRDAAVEFVMAMTSDEVVSNFGATSITALENPTIAPADISSLGQDAIAMTAGATGVVAATQDGLNAEARGALFAGVKDVVEELKSPSDLLGQVLELG